MKKILKLLEIHEFSMVYQIMSEAFPMAEIRTYENAKSLLKDDRYQIETIRNAENRIFGFIAAWDLGTFIFIEHLAVSEKIRGTGFGSKMLKEYLDRCKRPVIIEVESTKMEGAKRRIDFYKRMGFSFSNFGYTQPDLQNTSQKIDLNIMSYPNQITKKEFLSLKKLLFRQVYQADAM